MSEKTLVVLVTGSSANGIGGELCNHFAAKGCKVYAGARDPASVEATGYSGILPIKLDVTVQEEAEAVIKEIIEKEGKIDILVNNAGTGGAGPALEVSPESAQETFSVNLFAVIRMTQLVAKHMIPRRKGLIINVGSVVGLVSAPWSAVYSASKAALHSWSDALRMEVKGFGLKVMVVTPGSITSQFGKKQIESLPISDKGVYANVKKHIEARAMASQDPRTTMPASVFAKGVVSDALRAHPSFYYLAGGNSWLFWILERGPRRLAWFILGRAFGIHFVGQTTPAN